MENMQRKDEQKGKKIEFLLLWLPSDHLSVFMATLGIFPQKITL